MIKAAIKNQIQKYLVLMLLLASTNLGIIAQSDSVITGAEQTNQYLSLLKGKKVAIMANPSSRIGSQHLVDSLILLKIDLIKIFSPEHGFRGDAEAGEKVLDGKDQKTGLPLISLYGKHKKPTTEDLANVDVLIFDLQDVGTRFYTYISSLHYVMEACAEKNIPVIVFDRPNPNGFYVDGPVLKKGYESFVGMHPVPVVHGMTIGEYGQMITGQGWLKDGIQCDLTIIPCSNYDHTTLYSLPVKPSPNLPNMSAVYLYPGLCFFEGTVMSIGRGTDHPFQCYGHPDFSVGSYTFTPKSIQGASLHPKHEGQLCFGADLSSAGENVFVTKKLNITWLIGVWEVMHKKVDFFTSYFEKLAGSDELRKQIEAGKSEEEIRQSWQKDLTDFMEIRKKYLLYPDFE